MQQVIFCPYWCYLILADFIIGCNQSSRSVAAVASPVPCRRFSQRAGWLNISRRHHWAAWDVVSTHTLPGIPSIAVGHIIHMAAGLEQGRNAGARLKRRKVSVSGTNGFASNHHPPSPARQRKQEHTREISAPGLNATCGTVPDFRLTFV